MAGSLSGQGNPLTGISFEIPRGVLPAAPLQTGAITDTAGTVYRITQVTNQDFTNSFVCVVIQQ
ncbi:hypothetical protein [Sandarakinorhabdus sp.]|uniref:hypothetical protein n=1 Tax=Sandarakinorhabdus sp. TaxID=1916663 RepID=UPI00286E9E5B|nr:hypothetical protein [Sandarakinorhabdus sp.]